ncbi:MAG: hypothetical protein K1X91_02045 [Bacteriodetes bacterium]|nr:hypothetical protein [Bacteroidota bacterium]
MKNKSVLLVVVFFLTISLCLSQTKKNIVPFQFDSVVAVEYNSEKYFLPGKSYEWGEPFVVLSNGKLHPTVTKKVALQNQEANELVKSLLSPKTYDKRLKTACFIPRMGFVFYKGDSIVSHASVCLQCNQIDITPKLPVVQKNGGVLSIVGQKYFESLCKKLDFLYCKESIYENAKEILQKRYLNIPFDTPHCIQSISKKPIEISNRNICIISYWFSSDYTVHNDFLQKQFASLSKLYTKLKPDPFVKVMMVDMNTAPLENGSYREEFVHYVQKQYPAVYYNFDAYCPEQQKADDKPRGGEIYIVGHDRKLKLIVHYEEDNPDFTEWYVMQLVDVLRSENR